jgi:transcriptional regulator with PAS, ATPase and Fis domain
MKAAEINNYFAMVEANPAEFLNQYPLVMPKLKTEQQRNIFRLYRAMALVQIKQLPEAYEEALALLNTVNESKDQQLLAEIYIVLSKSTPEGKIWVKNYLESAFHTAQESNDNDLIGKTLNFLADYYMSDKDNKKAFKYYGMAEELVRKGNNHTLLETILMNTATAYYNLNQLDKAIQYLSQALEQNKKTGNKDRQLMCMCNISILYCKLYRFEEAENLLIKAQQIAEADQMLMRKAIILLNLGNLYLHWDKYQDSVESFMQCITLCQQIGFNNPGFFFELYSNMAGAYRFAGGSDKSLECLDKAQECAEVMQDAELQLNVIMNRANLLIFINRHNEAYKILKKVITASRKKKNYERWIIAQTNLADVYENRKEYTKALATLKELNFIYKEYMAEVLSAQTKEYDKKIAESYQKIEQADTEIKANPYKTEKSFIGNSEASKKVLELVRLAAMHPNTNVLIVGESGTGKEIVASLIHSMSSRKQNPFVAVNTASITATLAESELFGHVKGAFTGATRDAKGIFQYAQHGSVFLDEIADMPFELQAKLLRALESRKITPVGSKAEIPINCRIISSTNRDLNKLIDQNLFRLDLMHRLNTITIHIPPLRDRKEDIKPLIDYYVTYCANELKVKTPVIERSFYQGIMHYPFPGNVRELKNIIEHLLILHKNEVWRIEHLQELNLTIPKNKTKLSIVKEKYISDERHEIIEALQKSGGKQKHAAKLLGISESTLCRRITKYGLSSYTLRGD